MTPNTGTTDGFFLKEIRQIGRQTRELLIHPDYCPQLCKFHIFLAGISKTSPQFHFVNRVVKRAQILVCLRGKGRVYLSGSWQPFTAGQAYCTPRGHPSAYSGAYGCDMGWITYGPDMDLSVDQAMVLDVDPRPLEHVLYGLHQEVSGPRDSESLDHWTALLETQGKRIMSARGQDRLWRLWQIVQAQLANGWTLSQLCEVSGFGPEYLRQICIQETGFPPMHQVARLRMQHALSLLSKGYKVEAVAEEVGYNNTFAFSTAFKRITGHSPSHYQT
ncbi:MAG: AraC family transcriptional regulator [Verrucomicrobiales bacterium]|jgi:AraC-like DNA-binding protein|nr:AraC family transcriptional regulator [Verrucomicrobiales bacterium]